MKSKPVLSLLLALPWFMLPAHADYDKTALVNDAKGAVKALAGPLQMKLKTAMQAGGPASAIDVCKTIAPQLARSVSAEKGMDVTRVSLKNRNSVIGVPNEWQTEVLQDFEKRKRSGEDPKTISYAAVIDNQFRFMKAVPTAAVCLKCHGSELAPDVARALNKAYPNDKATGFKEGDIRGAFVVVKDLN